MLSYPENLPLPLQANYSESVSPNVKRSSMSDGYIRQRKVTSNAPRSLAVTWYFNSEQLVQFEDFLIRLNEGADWFLLKIPTKQYTEGLTSFVTAERTVRFQSGKYTKTLQFFSDDKWLWKIAANLDLSMDDYAVDDVMPPEETQWNTNSEYEFEFLVSGGVPIVRGKKKCFITSVSPVTGGDDYVTIQGNGVTVGLDFYTEGIKLTSEKKILEIDSEYEGIGTASQTYYFIGRASSVDAVLMGVGLVSGRNSTKETIGGLFDELTNSSYTSLSRISRTTYTVNIPYGESIQRRDIFINDTENNQFKYYQVMNDMLCYEAVYSGVRNWTAVFYQIGDAVNRGKYNNIKLKSLKVKNALFKKIPEGV